MQLNLESKTAPESGAATSFNFQRLMVTENLFADERKAIELAYADFECAREIDFKNPFADKPVETKHVAGEYSTALQQGRSGEDRVGVHSITGVDGKTDLEMRQALADAALLIDWEVRHPRDRALLYNKFGTRRSGSTLAAALLCGDQGQRKIHTVYAGDSHVYLISKKPDDEKYTGKHLSRIHKPDGLDEHLRCEALAGRKRLAYYRNPGESGLNVARGIGENESDRQKGVIPIPGVFTYTCAPGEVGWLVTISDGGDRLSVKDIAELLDDAAEDDNVAEKILREARKGQTDDIGVTAVRIDQKIKPGQAKVNITCDGHGDEGKVASHACEQLPGRIEAALKGELKLPNHQEIDGDAIAEVRVRRRQASGYDQRTDERVLERLKNKLDDINIEDVRGYREDRPYTYSWSWADYLQASRDALEKALRGEKDLSPSDFIKIKRLVDIHRPAETPPRELLKNLSALPSPALQEGLPNADSVEISQVKTKKQKKKRVSWKKEGELVTIKEVSRINVFRPLSLFAQWQTLDIDSKVLHVAAGGAALVAVLFIMLHFIPGISVVSLSIAGPIILVALGTVAIMLYLSVSYDRKHFTLALVESLLLDNKARLLLGAGLGVTLFLLLTVVFGVFGGGFSVPLMILTGVGFAVGFTVFSLVIEKVFIDWGFVTLLSMAANYFAAPMLEKPVVTSTHGVLRALANHTVGWDNFAREWKVCEGGHHYVFAVLRGLVLTCCDITTGQRTDATAETLAESADYGGESCCT